jgi:glyoxylase-like metal-dependent hydrolase (beta-lactamase superfamily II)
VIEKIVEGVYWIAGKDKFLPDSHVYLVGLPDSKDFTMVDCGLMGMGSYKLGEIESIGVKLENIKRVVLTHTHLDHIGCLPEIVEAIPGIEIWVHEEEGRFMERADDRIIFGNQMFESMIRSQYTIPKGFFDFKPHRKLKGGEVLDLGGVIFKVIYIPGHSIGSIGLFNEEHRIFMSGDTVYADGAIGRYDLFSADASQLKASLELISKLGVDYLLPCHNRIVKGSAEPMIDMTVRNWSPLLS